MKARTIVVADDSEIIRDAVRELFESVGAEVHEIGSAIGLSGLVRRVKPDAVLLDLNMPAIRGDEAIAAIRAVAPNAAIVLFSDDGSAAELAKAHGVAWVSKTAPQKLVSAVMRAARERDHAKGDP
jgi:CheY-like chemotaxis protein